MVAVSISPEEFVRCAAVGMRRFASSSAKGHNHASTYERSFYLRLEEETVGAVGEYAFCKYLGVAWDESVDTYHNVPDVGSVEVRATRLDVGSLIVRDNDADDRVFVLVTGTPPQVEIRGWIRGGDAKRPEFSRNPNAYRQAWFVPQRALGRLKGDLAVPGAGR